MKLKVVAALAISILTGCSEPEKALTTIQLKDGSELKLAAKIIENTRKPTDNGEMVITKVSSSESKEVVTTELDEKLKALGYKDRKSVV